MLSGINARRIYRAVVNGQNGKVRSLTGLLLKSYSNLLTSVRQITQINAGKQTAGIDGRIALTPESRMNLVKELRDNNWLPSPTKRVYIPKKNRKLRPLGIPTIKDRVIQNVAKNALEPCWEASFEEHSYGFRPGRSCHDAIEQCFVRLNPSPRCSNNTWVLDADILGFFDNISHKTILENVKYFPGRRLIQDWLKAGYLDKAVLNPTRIGTPQGGVISPLLANIGLHGLQYHLQKVNPKIGFIRYADDFLVTARSLEEINGIIAELETWLKSRSLELSPEKTRIVHINDGVNFLGFNLRRYDGKLLIKPQKEDVLEFCKNLGKEIKKRSTWKQENLINWLNPILRGKAEYYKHTVSKETFSYISHRVWQYLWRWAKRRHPKKGVQWIKNRYFHRVKGVDWTFAVKTLNRKGLDKLLTLYIVKSTSIERHVKVKGNASPDNPSLREYWAKRAEKHGKSFWEKNSRNYRIGVNQNWKCPLCGELLFNGEAVETHHLVPIKDGGTDEVSNLKHLHKACHQQVHGYKPLAKAKKLLASSEA